MSSLSLINQDYTKAVDLKTFINKDKYNSKRDNVEVGDLHQPPIGEVKLQQPKPVKELDDIVNELVTSKTSLDDNTDFVKLQIKEEKKQEGSNIPELSFVDDESTPLKVGNIPALDNIFVNKPKVDNMFVEKPKTLTLPLDLKESKITATVVDYDPYKNVSSENADFYYVNGIMTTKDDAKHTAEILTGIMRKDVKSLWSEKEGLWGDLIKATKIDESNNNGKVSPETASEITENVLKSLEDGKNVKLVAHSRGASEVANALWDVRSRLAIFHGKSTAEINQMMQKIEVITMGGLAGPKDFPYDIKLTQIRNPNDPIPKLNDEKIDEGNTRARYSRIEIEKALAEKQNGAPLEKEKLASLYVNNFKQDNIMDNIKQKLSSVKEASGPLGTVAGISTTAITTRMLIKRLPTKGFEVGKMVSRSITRAASTAGIQILNDGSKITAVNLVKPLKVTDGVAANIVKGTVNTAFKISPKLGAKTAQVFSNFGVAIHISKTGVEGINIGTNAKMAVQMAKVNRTVGLAKNAVQVESVVARTGKTVLESALNLSSKSNSLLALEKKFILKPKTLAVAGGIAVGVGAYFTIKQATSHLVNNGDSNYLGEKVVQDRLYRAAAEK